jgi:multicomponent Na+:H+ antiporter subunit D
MIYKADDYEKAKKLFEDSKRKISMINPIPPAFLFIFGAMLIPLFKGRLKSLYLLSVSVIAFIDLFFMETGMSWIYPFLNNDLIFLKVDRLSLVVGYIFILFPFN